jgi:hypothetical protein
MPVTRLLAPHGAAWLARNLPFDIDVAPRRPAAVASAQAAARLTVVDARNGYAFHVLLLWRDATSDEYWAWELYDHACSDELCSNEYDQVASGATKADVRERVPTDLWALLDAAAAPPKKELWIECALAPRASEELAAWTRAQPHTAKPLDGAHHATVLYGLAEADVAAVEALLRDAPAAFAATVGTARYGRLSPVVLLPLECPALTQLFWRLYAAVPDCPHSLIGGAYDPHVTAFWATEAEAALPLAAADAFKGAQWEFGAPRICRPAVTNP